jgi:hypothetical protein
VPILVWVNSTNYHQKYITALINDPNVPAGFILTSGSDGATDEALQVYKAGINSGGFPAYTGDPSQRSDWPNGVLGGYPGGKINNP